MAFTTGTYLVDGLDGSEQDAETVHLSLDGTELEIDLTPANSDQLRKRLA